MAILPLPGMEKAIIIPNSHLWRRKKEMTNTIGQSKNSAKKKPDLFGLEDRNVVTIILSIPS